MRGLVFLNVITLIYLVGPILVVVASAFGATGYLTFPPHGLTLKWFAAALGDPRYANAFLTSLLIASVTTLIAVSIGIAAAYALARFDFPARRTIEALVLAPLVLPALILAVALTILFSRIGFAAGTARLVLAHLTICTPYVIRVATPVIERVDRALEEAAQNLGATPIATFFLVTLPAIKPGIIAATTLAFIVSFDEIDLAIFLASPRAPTLPVTIYSAIQLGVEPTVGAVSALLVLLALAAMTAYHVFWRSGAR